MKLHLVYAGSCDDERIQAPYSITRNLYNFLRPRVPVVYHQWDATYDVALDQDDIVLGHPHYSHNTIIQRIFSKGQPCRSRCLIHPFHHRRVEDNFPFNHLAMAADRIFAICGHYWIDTIESTPFAHWRPKMVHLNMAIDAHHFPFLKTSYNPVGARRLLFMGSSMPQKNLELMAAIMSRLPNVQLHWYGGCSGHFLERLPNVKTVGWSVFNHDLLSQIASECDIFISTSISDACPTALLEAAAIGFPIACTKESGINNVLVSELKLDDLDYNLIVINKLLNAPSEALLERTQVFRQRIETEHSWTVFCDKIWTELLRLGI